MNWAGILLLISFFLPVFTVIPKDLIINMPDGFTFDLNRWVWAFFFWFMYHISRGANLAISFSLRTKKKQRILFWGVIAIGLAITALVEFSVWIGFYVWFGFLICTVVGRVVKGDVVSEGK